MDYSEIIRTKQGSFELQPFETLPFETDDLINGDERGCSATVFVMDTENRMITTAWYDYELKRWQTDCPVDGFREEEMNDSTVEGKMWFRLSEGNPLADAVNEVWRDAYADECADVEGDALCLRVKQLATDRKHWLENAKEIQKENNRLERLLSSNTEDVDASCPKP